MNLGEASIAASMVKGPGVTIVYASQCCGIRSKGPILFRPAEREKENAIEGVERGLSGLVVERLDRLSFR